MSFSRGPSPFKDLVFQSVEVVRDVKCSFEAERIECRNCIGKVHIQAIIISQYHGTFFMMPLGVGLRMNS